MALLPSFVYLGYGYEEEVTALSIHHGRQIQKRVSTTQTSPGGLRDAILH